MKTMRLNIAERTWRLYSTLVSTTYPVVLEAPMSAQLPLYQVIHQRIAAALPHAIPRASITRLALLVTGILAAKSAVIAQIACRTRRPRPDPRHPRLHRPPPAPHAP